MLTASFSVFADDDIVTSCCIYDGVNSPVKANSLGVSAISETMEAAMGMAAASTSQKFEADGISVELSTASGCAMNCWNTRHVMVTRNEFSAYTYAEASSLNSEGIGNYPLVTMIVGKEQLSIKCFFDLAN